MKKQILIMLVTIMAATILPACGLKQGVNVDSATIIGAGSNDITDSFVDGITSGYSESGNTAATTDSNNKGDNWLPSFLLDGANEEKEVKDNYGEALAIASKGSLLFSGGTDESYYTDELSWLKNSDVNDVIAIAYACDDLEHGGWGVLGLGAEDTNKEWNQLDIKAFGENPDKERFIYYRIGDALSQLSIANATDITNFGIGAWNGGRIAGFYYLQGELANEFCNYMSNNSVTKKIVHNYSGKLSNSNSIKNAVSLYDYLLSMDGKGCLTGQMESTWMGSPDYEIDYIYNNTGKLPAIRGFDFIHSNFEDVTARANDWWNKGGIVTICWHTGADFNSGYDECKADNINWDEAFVPGSQTYNSLIAGMDKAVPYLKELEEKGVPVLWRPFHELDGGWFWWSKGGSENFIKLWKLMYERYTDYWGLNNLIWVYGYSHQGMNPENWYPGDEYVDLIGGDSYDPSANQNLYLELQKVKADGMPMVFHECGTIPTMEEMKEQGTPWLYFMVWHTEYLTDASYNTAESIKAIYSSDYFITLDELPSFN